MPIIFSGIGNVAIVIADTLFLSRLGETELGGAGNGGLLYFVFVMVGMGFATGAQIIIGRRNGEEDYKSIGKLFHATMYFQLLLASLFFLFILYATPLLLQSISSSQAVINVANEYLAARSWGIFAMLAGQVFLAFFVGITNTRVLAFATFFMAGVNIFLDYALIFGSFGFPEMGIKGAGIASATAEGAALLIYIVYTFYAVDWRKYNLRHIQFPKIHRLRNILNISAPVMLQNCIAMSGWFIFFSIIENIGERELAVSHIARSVYMVLIIPVFGFSSTANTLVSNLIGQQESDLVFKVLKRILMIGLICNLVIWPFVFFLPQYFLTAFTSDLTLIQDTIPTLQVISCAMFLFTVAWVLFQGLTGTGNTKIALLIEAFSISTYLLFAYTMVKLFQVSVEIAWSSEFVYFGMLTIFSLLYLKSKKWQHKKV